MANLKPFQVVLLSVFGVLALVGLFLFANFKGFGKNADQIGTVVIWGTIPQKAVTPSLAELKRLHKEFAKVSYSERQASSFDTDLANAIASGSGPDLILITQEQLVTEQSRLVIIPPATLSERAFRDTYLPGFDIYLTESGTYGIPFVMDPLVMYYNRTILATAGIATAPTTWEAVTGLSPTLTQVNTAQTVERSTVALGTYGNIDQARAILSLLFLQAGQGMTARGVNGVRSTLLQNSTGASGVSSTQSALAFYTEFSNPAKTTYSWNRSLPSSRQMFVQGDLALYLGYASEQGNIRAASPNLEFDMARTPSPATATSRVTYGKAYAFAVPKASKNQKGAVATAFAFTGSDTLPALARALGMAPGVRTMLTPSTKDLYEPVYYPEALIAKGWLSPAPAATDSVFAAMIDNVTSGRTTAGQALVAADQSLNAALGQ